jgi:hypothetical protein
MKLILALACGWLAVSAAAEDGYQFQMKVLVRGAELPPSAYDVSGTLEYWCEHCLVGLCVYPGEDFDCTGDATEAKLKNHKNGRLGFQRDITKLLVAEYRDPKGWVTLKYRAAGMDGSVRFFLEQARKGTFQYHYVCYGPSCGKPVALPLPAGAKVGELVVDVQ